VGAHHDDAAVRSGDFADEFPGMAPAAFQRGLCFHRADALCRSKQTIFPRPRDGRQTPFRCLHTPRDSFRRQAHDQRLGDKKTSGNRHIHGCRPGSSLKANGKNRPEIFAPRAKARCAVLACRGAFTPRVSAAVICQASVTKRGFAWARASDSLLPIFGKRTPREWRAWRQDQKRFRTTIVAMFGGTARRFPKGPLGLLFRLFQIGAPWGAFARSAYSLVR